MLKNLFVKYKEQISYLFFGVMTTVINFITYFALTKLFNTDEMIANIIAWIVSVAFAFVSNKLFVFESKSFDKNTLLKEITGFVSSRIASLGIDMTIMYIGINLLFINDAIVKIVSNVVVIVLNYILSKLIVFKDKK